jgi:hypothetical protein
LPLKVRQIRIWSLTGITPLVFGHRKWANNFFICLSKSGRFSFSFGPFVGQKSLYLPLTGKFSFGFGYFRAKVFIFASQILIWFRPNFRLKVFIFASNRQILLIFFGHQQWAKISTVNFQEVRQFAYNFSTLQGAKG